MIDGWGMSCEIVLKLMLLGRTDGWHDGVIKWKHFPRYWPFVRGIHRSPVNSPHKGQWRRALMFSLICVWINGWVNNGEAGDLRRYRAHYDVTVMDKSTCYTVNDLCRQLHEPMTQIYVTILHNELTREALYTTRDISSTSCTHIFGTLV